MKYYMKYELLKNLPTGQKAGDALRVHVSDDCVLRWWFMQNGSIWQQDFKGLSFTYEQIQNTEFFKPLDEPYDLVLPFPPRDKIGEYYHLIGENRVVPTVDQVRLINPIFYSNEFHDAVYELLKGMYNKKYGIGGEPTQSPPMT